MQARARLVIPIDPLEGFPFTWTDRFLRSEEFDDLGLEQADDAFGQGVVAAPRGLEASLSQPLRVLGTAPVEGGPYGNADDGFLLKVMDANLIRP